MFSVIVPLYNKRRYIRRCVESVLNQSRTDFELIVVDDGSTDGSHEVLADINDPRFRLIRQENEGKGTARNVGMGIARGVWFAFLDADDMWFPEHLAELDRIAIQCPDAGLISTRCLEVSDGTNPVIGNRGTNAQIRVIDYFLEASRNIGINNSSSTAVRGDVYCDVGEFSSYKAGEDLEYWARVAIHNPVALSNRVTSVYFRNTNGVMEQLAKQRKPMARPITSLRDISPSVAFLCDVAECESARWQSPSIRAYINSRVYNSIRGALYHGDLAEARILSKFLIPSSELRISALKLGLLLPDMAIKMGLAGFHAMKSIR